MPFQKLGRPLQTLIPSLKQSSASEYLWLIINPDSLEAQFKILPTILLARFTIITFVCNGGQRMMYVAH
jgi:hypothetical protein